MYPTRIRPLTNGFASTRRPETDTDAGDAGDPWIDAGHSRLNADDLRLDADSRLDAGDPRLEAGTTGSTLTKRLGTFRNILQILGTLGNIWGSVGGFDLI